MRERRVALVTGANRGMGFEVVRQLADHGVVVLLGARDAAMGEAARADLPTSDRERVAVCSFDVVDAERTARALRKSQDRYGPIDVLVNNAGIYPDESTPGLEIDPEIVRATFETNSLGALRLCQ